MRDAKVHIVQQEHIQTAGKFLEVGGRQDSG